MIANGSPPSELDALPRCRSCQKALLTDEDVGKHHGTVCGRCQRAAQNAPKPCVACGGNGNDRRGSDICPRCLGRGDDL